LAYDPHRQAPRCSFCDSVVKLETLDDPLEQSSGYLPFTVTPDEAHAALKRWLGTLGWFRPGDLLSQSRLHELRPLWWVAWVFDADSRISWTGDSNAGAGRSAWAPHAGETHVNFRNVLATASRGLSLAEVQAISPGLNLNSVRAEPELAGMAESAVNGQVTLEQFDMQRSQARRQVVDALHAMAIEHVKQHEIPGSSFRKVNVSIVVEGLVTRRFSLPAYVLAYRYKQELYRVVICGQDARLLIGKAPYSMAKIMLCVVSVVLFILFLLSALAVIA
jgi:hypothetical protein